jgi:hypothetical protein
MIKKPSVGRLTRATTGKCLCGRITFTFSAEPNWPHYCCCDDCQKWSGAPAVAWVDFPQSSFGLGDPENLLRKYKSGGLAHRAFCSRCGSSLFAIDDDGKNMSVTITTLDRPNLYRPEAVGYGGMAPHWLPTAALKKSSP